MYFAKHETFHMRDGWLYKGLKAVTDDPRIFLRRDAPERLGLGKNMVRALRFWVQATELTVEEFSDRKRVQTLTPFGNYVLACDPYQELDGTLWLLHHHLMCSRELATTWYWFFNHYIPMNFTYRDFEERLDQWINTQAEDGKKVAKSSLRKDFDCLVRTYLPSQKDVSPEDLMESPLASLGLLSTFTERDERDKRVRVYRLETGLPQNIPPLVLLYVLLNRQEIERPDASQVNLHMVLNEPMNVGRTFSIGMLALEELLMRLEDDYPKLHVQLIRTGGLDQLTLPKVSSEEVLREFYEKQTVTEEVQVWSRPLSL